ncbi:hypothetical protein Pfo_021836, partial [Paulownia fortunei]
MEKHSSSENTDAKEEMLSCWGRFMLIFSWKRSPKNNRKLKYVGSSSTTFSFSKSKKRAQPSGAFRYSPLSYAQNFDEGHDWETDDQDSLFRGFSSRIWPFLSKDLSHL